MFISAPQYGSCRSYPRRHHQPGPNGAPKGGNATQGYDSTGQDSQGAVGGCSPPNPPSRCRARPHRITETEADRHTGVWRPATGYHLAHALSEPAALPTLPELRDHPHHRPSRVRGIAVGRAMRASCYSDRGPDHDRRRVTPRSSFPVSLAALVSTPSVMLAPASSAVM